jgi:hypothetical protein
MGFYVHIFYILFLYTVDFRLTILHVNDIDDRHTNVVCIKKNVNNVIPPIKDMDFPPLFEKTIQHYPVPLFKFFESYNTIVTN